jgi:uncharacterized membrane protein YccC
MTTTKPPTSTRTRAQHVAGYLPLVRKLTADQRLSEAEDALLDVLAEALGRDREDDVQVMATHAALSATAASARQDVTGSPDPDLRLRARKRLENCEAALKELEQANPTLFAGD